MSRILHFAQGTVLFTAAAAATGNLMITAFIVPRLLEAPTPTMLKQWRNTFLQGMSVFKTTFLVTSAGFLGLAYNAGLRTPRGRMLAASGVLTVSIIPYTKVLMMSTNRELLAMVAQEVDGKAEKREVAITEDRAKRLVDNWGMLNLGRSALATVAGIVAFAAVLA